MGPVLQSPWPPRATLRGVAAARTESERVATAVNLENILVDVKVAWKRVQELVKLVGLEVDDGCAELLYSTARAWMTSVV